MVLTVLHRLALKCTILTQVFLLPQFLEMWDYKCMPAHSALKNP